MQMLELAIWSASAGAIALVVLASVADWAIKRNLAALHATLYNAACLAFVVLLSGLAGALLPRAWSGEIRIAQVLVGPLCACLGDLWLRAWLGARYRDRLMDLVLLSGGVCVPVLGLAAVALLPVARQLPFVAVVVLLNTVIVVWMSTRAWLLGDRLAPGMTAGAVLMFTSTGGLFATAMPLGIGLVAQGVGALASALCVAVIGAMLWQRNHRRARVAQEVHSQFDAVTKLPSSVPLVRHIVRAQKRRRLSRRDGALIAVLVFEPERIRNVAGVIGLNEAYLHVAQRLQHQVGVVNVVGRYWDRCFVAMMESIHSAGAVRTVGLRVATSLRRPMDVTAADGSRVQVRLDVGVGVLRLGREIVDVDEVLHEVQLLAEAARSLSSRAATLDPSTGEVVAVEDAELGPRRNRARSRRAPAPMRRPLRQPRRRCPAPSSRTRRAGP
jgi:GGDEF domain-containing protein